MSMYMNLKFIHKIQNQGRLIFKDIYRIIYSASRRIILQRHVINERGKDLNYFFPFCGP